MESVHTCSFSVPVFISKSTPSDCCLTAVIGLRGAHCALAIATNGSGTRQSRDLRVMRSCLCGINRPIRIYTADRMCFRRHQTTINPKDGTAESLGDNRLP